MVNDPRAGAGVIAAGNCGEDDPFTIRRDDVIIRHGNNGVTTQFFSAGTCCGLS